VDEIKKNLRRDTRAVIINHVSNLPGEIAPIREIGEFCAKNGLIFIVDGAQSAGYTPIDTALCHIDTLAIAPHKGLHAAMGSGALIVGKNAKIKPLVLGGTGSDTFDFSQPPTLPDGIESGTLPLPAIASIAPAVEWCEQNAEVNREKTAGLSEILLEFLAHNEIIRLYTPADLKNGVIAFNVGDLDSSTVGDFLNEKYGICVRCGFHCAPLMHKFLGTAKSGAVRVSIGCDNCEDDIKTLITAIKELEKSL
jgi:selenocysteine lyase/cysteine desulfurase